MRGYTFLDTTIAVTTGVPAIAQWLDEFLVPAFDRWTGDAAAFVVRVRAEAAAHEAIAANRPPGALVAAPCFALDREVVRHPSWTASRRTLLADAKYGAFYVLDGKCVDVVADPGSRLFRGGAMRVIRELATARALADPERLQLHAAAFAIGGRAVLIAGTKGSGKTTLLAYLARTTGASILGNDRAVVSRHGGDVRVRGVPTIVSVRPETRALIPCLFDGIAALDRPAHRTLAEADAALAAGETAGTVGRVRLSPAQLARQLGVALAAEAGLEAVLFPETDRDPEGLTVDRLTPAESRTRLLESRFGLQSGKTEPTVFDRLVGGRRPDDADASAIDALAATIPCFAVRIGAGRLRAAAGAEAIVSAVLTPGAGR